MREAVYLSITGAAPSIDAALGMDEVTRSAVINLVKEIQREQQRELAHALRVALLGE